jgi:hypothetical protein
MSVDTTINFTFKPDGSTLTDATAVFFGDGSSVYGVRKVSDETIVVAANTSFTHDDTGEYSSTIADLEQGVEYEFYIAWTYGGNTTRQYGSFVAEDDVDLGTQAFVRQMKLVQGDSAGPDSVPIIVGFDFDKTPPDRAPSNLSDWTWAIAISKGTNNQNADAPDTIAGTVTVYLATGGSRSLRISMDADDTEEALGLYDWCITGTNDDEERRSPILGLFHFVPNYAPVTP